VPNPFTPSFGVSPPLLVGRDEPLERFGEAFDDGPGSPGRATVYTGARGTGKTVLLNAVEDFARERGWLVISETASPGFVRRLVQEHLPALLRDQDPGAATTRFKGLTAPVVGGGATWDTTQNHVSAPGLRNQMTLLCDLLAEQGTGLLVTLDEIHQRQRDELRELATTVQHLFREGREMAFVGAGLPSAVSEVLSDEVLTFLRRADRYHLGRVSFDDVAEAIGTPIRDAGRSITLELSARAAQATDGYPFLIQLVGYQIWRLHPGDDEVSAEDVDVGILAALRRLGSLVVEPSLADLSNVDRTFLLAMAQDDGPSRMIDVANRLNCDANYASQYRLRLLAAELIETAGHGAVTFALPYLREYLREHGALDAQRGLTGGRATALPAAPLALPEAESTEE
jgi:hypothetical protein